MLRAGRVDEAIVRLNEGIAAARRWKSPPTGPTWHWPTREEGTSPKPAGRSNASALAASGFVGIVLGSPGARPPPKRGRVPALSMPSFRVIPSGVGGRDEPTHRPVSLAASVTADPAAKVGCGESGARTRTTAVSPRIGSADPRRTPLEPAFLVVKFLLLGEHRQDCREAFLPRLGLLRRLQSPNNCIHICSV